MESSSAPQTASSDTAPIPTDAAKQPRTPPKASAVLPPQFGSTPPKPTLNAQQGNAIVGIKRRKLRDRFYTPLDIDMSGNWVEIPVDKFSDFLPGDEPTDTVLATFNEETFDESKFTTTNEEDMYTPYCSTAEKILALGPEDRRLVARDTGRYTDTRGSPNEKMRPDVILYPATKKAEDAYSLKENELAKAADMTPEQKMYVARPSWAWADLVMNSHPFHFAASGEEFLLDTEAAMVRRGQIANYAAAVLRNQHRQFCFMVVAAGCRARLLRWDRSGAVVSKSFDFVRENKDIMFRFLYKYSCMSQEERGYDPTFVEATPADVDAMKAWKAEVMKDKKARLSDYQSQCFDRELAESWPVYRVTIPKEDLISDISLTPGNKQDQGRSEPSASGEHICDDDLVLLVGKPNKNSSSPVGRGMQGYVAYDVRKRRLVYLKDSWRPDLEDAHPEHKTYIHLWQHNVKNIAKLLSGGDVRIGNRIQRTLAQDCVREVTKVKHLGRVHYRIVFSEVYRPLETYGHSLDMVEVICDALKAHRDAWEKADVLHRDISDGNVMIQDTFDENGCLQIGGILNDWDLAKFKSELENPPSRRQRSGTWQFMSAFILSFPEQKKHTVSDDLESFVHLTNWLVLKWHLHHFSPHPALLKRHVTNTYDAFAENAEGLDLGGEQKHGYLSTGEIPFAPVQKSPPLEHLTKALAETCHAHYDAHKEEWQRLLDIQRRENAKRASKSKPMEKPVIHRSVKAEYLQRSSGSTSVVHNLQRSQELSLIASFGPLDDHNALISIYSDVILTFAYLLQDGNETDKLQQSQFKDILDTGSRSQNRSKRPSQSSEEGQPRSKKPKRSPQEATGEGSSLQTIVEDHDELTVPAAGGFEQVLPVDEHTSSTLPQLAAEKDGTTTE
ncbi:predicted protein [Postia placenta Mad-698-R]|nr:predicted protein [Postia placenta Mad-698-R]